jgi:ArsR family transcriptional regulator
MGERDEGTCEARVVHGARLAALQPLIAGEERAQVEAERFRALGDPTRLRILCALGLTELCVCDLSGLLGITQTAASQHLKILRTFGMVRYRKQGRMAFYRLADLSLTGLLARLREAPGREEAAGERQSG